MMLDYLTKIRWDVFLFLLTAIDKKEMIRNQVFFRFFFAFKLIHSLYYDRCVFIFRFLVLFTEHLYLWYWQNIGLTLRSTYTGNVKEISVDSMKKIPYRIDVIGLKCSLFSIFNLM